MKLLHVITRSSIYSLFSKLYSPEKGWCGVFPYGGPLGKIEGRSRKERVNIRILTGEKREGEQLGGERDQE